MTRSNPAMVTSEVISWARLQIGLPASTVANRLGTSEAKLAAWEAGSALPTLRQARMLSRIYRQPFAAFFLPTPPQTKVRVPRDYRRLAGTALQVSPPLHGAVIEAWEKREVALELLSLQNVVPPAFDLSASPAANPEAVGAHLREVLKVAPSEQIAKSARVAFNEWRGRVEKLGVLVLQTSDVDVEELRAFSVYEKRLPVIVVNRKDPPAARSFSLMHECIHLMLHTEGVCDLSSDPRQSPELQAIEVFCNAAAAACLMPEEAVRQLPLVWHHDPKNEWTNQEIEQAAGRFGVSREAILRRLLTLGLTTQSFYERKRREYREEYRTRVKTAGFMTPTADALSSLGKPYVRLVLTALHSGDITHSDASDYLGLRLKHLPTLSAALSRE